MIRNGPVSIDVPGLTSDAVLGFLRDCVLWKKPLHCLEIGPWMGRSTAVICNALEEIGGGGTLTSVDFFVQDYGRAYVRRKKSIRLALQRCGPEVEAIYTDFTNLRRLEDCFALTRSRHPAMAKRNRLIKAVAAEADLSSVDPLDLIFIDADSTYDGTRANLRVSLPKSKSGVLIIIDGYGSDHQPGVAQCVDEILAAGLAQWHDCEGVDVAFTVPEPNRLIGWLTESQQDPVRAVASYAP